MRISGDTLDIALNLMNRDLGEPFTCERSYTIAFDNLTPGHYIVNLHYDDNFSLVGLCDTTITDGFKYVVFDNRKPLPENCFPGENYVIGECLAGMDYEPGDPHKDGMPAEDELGSIRLSYAQDTLSVELRGWFYFCGFDMWPLAVLNDDTFEIHMDIDPSLTTACLCYRNISYAFCGIKPGEYNVHFMDDEYDGPGDRNFNVKLQDGFSHLFLKGPANLSKVNYPDGASICFDGSLIELNVEANSATMEIFSTEGELMARTEGKGNIRLSTTSLMPGVYIVRATTADGHATQRKIVVK